MNKEIKRQPVSEKAIKIKRESVSIVMIDQNGIKTQIKLE